MLRFDVITIFPELFEPFVKESLIAKAQKKRLISLRAHNLRDWTDDPHHKVDDSPYGGGLGMVMKVGPIFKAVTALKKTQNTNSKTQIKHKTQNTKTKTKVVVFTPRGERFTQETASKLAKLDQIIMICGRYEGIDERVAEHIADYEISMGEYVLMGGEIPAMAVVEAVARLVPGVVGKSDFLKERQRPGSARATKAFVEYPEYTRPSMFSPKKGTEWKVPDVLLSGHQAHIEKWKQERGRTIGK